MRARRLDEAGFTLIELLVAIALLAMLVPAVAGAMIVSLNTFDETADRVVASSDRNLLSAYLVPDVQSASSIDGTTGTCVGGGEGLLVGIQRHGGVAVDWVHRGADVVRRDCSAGTETVVVVGATSVTPTATPDSASVTVTGPDGRTVTVTAHRRSS